MSRLRAIRRKVGRRCPQRAASLTGRVVSVSGALRTTRPYLEAHERRRFPKNFLRNRHRGNYARRPGNRSAVVRKSLLLADSLPARRGARQFAARVRRFPVGGRHPPPGPGLLRALHSFPHRVRPPAVHVAETRKRWIRVENIESPIRAQDKGKGILLLTGHFGNWEVATVAGHRAVPAIPRVVPFRAPAVEARVVQ